MSDIINILINKVNAINDYIDKTSKVCHVIDDEGIEHIIPMYPSNCTNEVECTQFKRCIKECIDWKWNGKVDNIVY